MLHVNEVAYLRFTAEVANEDDAWPEVYEHRLRMRREAEAIVQEILGQQYTISTFVVGRGSITLLIVLSTAFAGYVAVSRYKNFVESISVVRGQIERILRDELVQFRPQVQSAWAAGPGLAETVSPTNSTEWVKMLLLLYLILSHAALLTVFIWKVLKA
jgi:hypothetical protein